MLKTYLTHEDIINEDRTLQKWLSDDQLDFDLEIRNAYPDMIKDLRHRKDLNLRLLNIRLVLETDQEQAGAFDGTVSSEDKINRSRLLLTIKTLVGDGSFKLLGSDNAEADIADWIEAKSDIIFVSEIGEYSINFYDYYKFYRLQKTSTTNAKYSVDMTETIYDFLHLYKTVERIYRQLNKLNDDAFSVKQELYKDKYEELLINGRFYYDKDESGDYDSDELRTDSNIIRVGVRQ
jgi:hypothetical protein